MRIKRMERKDAIEILTDMYNYYSNTDDYGSYVPFDKEDKEALEMTIASLKTDEAYQLEYENRDCVEVVRCKDCKHYKGNICEWHNGFKPPLDWYCADGEKE
jgi:hypothetical protein